ncbi:hypothetical protein E4U33_004375 [Claviceps sp. LM78 group G4]|nr:hypothetical protein E4U33_004375 [Claviceps sp. LM78 group G4]
MVPAKVPDEPFELKSLYISGAIPNLSNLEACMVSDEPLKRRLRPRRCKPDKAGIDAEYVTADARPRKRRKPLRSSPRTATTSAQKSLLKPKKGGKVSTTEMYGSDGMYDERLLLDWNIPR